VIELRVSDVKQRDVSRGIGRISRDTMQKLGISTGDVIEVKGKKSTAVISWDAYEEDQTKEIIRIDGFTRKNAGVNIGEPVEAKPAEVKDASLITLEPIDLHIMVDKNFTAFVKNRLSERVFVEGDTTLLVMLGHPVQFMVTETVPDGIVKMTYDTDLVIKSGPLDKEAVEISGGALRPFGAGKRDNTVMTRLSDDDLKDIDTLVRIGLFESRSEAVAYLTHEGIIAKKEMFGQLTSKLEQIEKIRGEAKALLGTSATLSNLEQCPNCGKNVTKENKFCPNCGQKIE